MIMNMTERQPDARSVSLSRCSLSPSLTGSPVRLSSTDSSSLFICLFVSKSSNRTLRFKLEFLSFLFFCLVELQQKSSSLPLGWFSAQSGGPSLTPGLVQVWEVFKAGCCLGPGIEFLPFCPLLAIFNLFKCHLILSAPPPEATQPDLLLLSSPFFLYPSYTPGSTLDLFCL